MTRNSVAKEIRALRISPEDAQEIAEAQAHLNRLYPPTIIKLPKGG
jgi:hypothetical protein